MSAEIIILPLIRVERPQRSDDKVVALQLGRRDYARLNHLAREWNLSDTEAAEMLLSEALEKRVRGK